MAGYMTYAHLCAWLVESCCNDESCNMVDRNHVDGVSDVRTASNLDTTLEHADEEVIGVGGYGKSQ